MQTIIWGMLAETAIHTGSGRNLGVVDLPVMREATTDMPVIPGSGLKGAMREQVEQEIECNRIFGSADNAGLIQVSDARLLLLPVRSLTTSYRWATCPLILERVLRDLERGGNRQPSYKVPAVAEGKAFGKKSEPLYLEEREFQVSALEGFDTIVTCLQKFIRYDTTKNRLADSLIILSDDDFAWFCRYGLQVQARNQLDENKKSKNLWYEESLPTDTLMYCLLSLRQSEDLAVIRDWWKNPYVRVGGNETVGLGWFAISEVGA